MAFEQGPGSIWFRQLSPEVEVEWAGWRATLIQLQSRGWDIAVEENHMERRYGLYIKHREAGVVGYGEFTDDLRRFFRHDGGMMYRGPHLFVRMKVANNIHLPSSMMPSIEYGHAIDARPSFVEEPIESLRHAKVFRSVDPKPEQEILLKEPTLMEILELALEKQEPEQQRIRNNIVRESELKANLRLVV